MSCRQRQTLKYKKFKRNKTRKQLNHNKYNCKVQRGGTLSPQLEQIIQVRLTFLPDENKIVANNLIENATELYKTIPSAGFEETGKITYNYNFREGKVNMNQIFENNIKNFESKVNPGNPMFWSSKTCLTVINMHGNIEETRKNMFQRVPANTIICFMAPLDYTLIYANQSNFNLSHRLNNLTSIEYQEIFRKHMNLRNIGFGSYNMQDKDSARYNCFTDSMWYYPGQIYPDLDLSLSHADYKTNDNEGVQFSTLVRGRVTNISDTQYLNTTEIKKKIATPKSYFSYILSDIVEYKKFLNKFRIIIAVSCRNIDVKENEELKKKIIYLEILTYHLNVSNVNKADIRESKGFQSLCHNISNKKYCYLYENKYFYGDEKYRNINLDATIPNLEKLYQKFELEESLSECEYNYMYNLSFKKLYFFLIKFSPEKCQKLVRRLISNNASQLNYTFKRFAHIFESYTYFKNYIPEDEYKISTIEYMIKMKNLIISCGSLPAISITQQITQFQEDFETIVSSNIFPTLKKKLDSSGSKNIFLIDEEIEVSSLNAYKNINTLYVAGNIYSKMDFKLPFVKKVVLGKEVKNIYDLSTKKTEDYLDSIFTLFPDCEELVFKGCFSPEISFEKNTKKYPKLKILKIINTHFFLDVNKFPNLTYLEIINNDSYTELILRPYKIKQIILTDLPNLKILNTTHNSLKYLSLNSINPNINIIDIGSVESLKIENCFFSNEAQIIKPKGIQDLELFYCQIDVEILKKMIPKPGKLPIFGTKRLKNLSLYFVVLNNLGEPKKQKIKEFFESIKQISNIKIHSLMEIEDGTYQKIIVTKNNFKNFSKKTKISIDKDNFEGEATKTIQII